MADQRYCNTASSGGDGTTNAISGGTAAFASQSSAEANMGGSATENYFLDCCGTAADTTAVTWDFPVNITSGSYTIRGNRADAVTPNAGFYAGTVLISTAHYRLVVASGTPLKLVEQNGVVDGIQIEANGGANQQAIDIKTTGAETIRNCHLRAASATSFGIGSGGAGGDYGTAQRVIENNLIVGFDTGIAINVSSFFSRNFMVRENTIYGDGSSFGINIVLGGSTTQTITVSGNALANHGAGNCFTGTAADSYADNGCDSAESTSGEVALTPANDWVSPGTAQSSDFAVKNTSSALYDKVNPTLVTTDATGFTRDGTNHDIGCFELQAAAGAIAGTSALAFSSTATVLGSGALAGTSALAFTPTGTVLGSGALAGTSAAVFTPTGTVLGSGALAGTSAASFTLSGTLDQPSGSFSGASAITFVPSATLLASGVLSGASALGFSGTAQLTGLSSGSISGTVSMQFGGSATFTIFGRATGGLRSHGTRSNRSTGIRTSQIPTGRRPR